MFYGYFTWTKENRDKKTTRAFFPGGEFSLENWKACLMDWATIGVLFALVAVVVACENQMAGVILAAGVVVGLLIRKLFVPR